MKRIRVLKGLVCSALALVLIAGAFFVPVFADQGSRDERIAGDTRYDTAFAVANYLYSGYVDNVVIASGTNFPDALSGSYLAAEVNGPILLWDKAIEDGLLDFVANRLKSGATVYLLGGEKAIPTSFETKLKNRTRLTVKRLGGTTRYDTNIEIIEEILRIKQKSSAGSLEFLVCSGKGFADSLSASAVDKPILLVGDELTSGQKAFLNKYGDRIKKYYVIGGEKAVSSAVERQLTGATARIGGATRFETSEMVARTFFKNSPKKMVLCYSHNFPDGLTGGPLAGKMNAPILLVNSGNYAHARDYAKSMGTVKFYAIGGNSVISNMTLSKITFCKRSISGERDAMEYTWDYIYAYNDKWVEYGNTGVMVDRKEGSDYIVRVYSNMDTHISTLAWYRITPYGDIYDDSTNEKIY